MKQIEIHLTQKTEIDAVHAIFAENLPEVWSKEALFDEIDYPYSLLISAVVDGQVAGFLDARFVFGDGELLNIAVDPEFRRFGVGNALLTEMVNRAKTEKLTAITLEVRSQNLGARRFYESFGFEEIGIRKRFYESPEDDAVLYQLQLED